MAVKGGVKRALWIFMLVWLLGGNTFGHRDLWKLPNCLQIGCEFDTPLACPDASNTFEV